MSEEKTGPHGTPRSGLDTGRRALEGEDGGKDRKPQSQKAHPARPEAGGKDEEQPGRQRKPS